MSFAAPPPARLLKSWGDEAVVYDTASGDTHYLKPLALALYRICQEQPGLGSAELTAALAKHLDIVPDPQFQALSEEALTSLRRTGLLQTP